MTNGVKFFNVRLIHKPSRAKLTPFVSIFIECLAAKSKEEAKARALSIFALAGHHVQIQDIVEL